MPRMIDLIRESKLPSNMMQFAAKGALSVPADENIQILVYLAKHNKIFGDTARLTLAGWDEKSSLAAAADPNTPSEVLHYLIAPENVRPKLLPELLKNPSVSEGELAKFAISAATESVAIMLQSPRITASQLILDVLRSNPYLTSEQASTVAKLLKVSASETSADPTSSDQTPAVSAAAVAGASAGQPANEVSDEGDDVPDESVSAYLTEHAAEIDAEKDKPFQAVGGILELLGEDYFPVSEIKEVAPVAVEEKPVAAAAAAPAPRPKPAPAPPKVGQRDNAVQKINRLDVKGRIQLAIKGNKEERSILIRDGTKVVALAVLDAPKLSDGEVEKFALQKNVLEAVLRQIPLKRRFMKNYIVVRNLVSNPRTPLDLGLTLMKHLQPQDLKNVSANKEVSETVRKLALKMYKQKLETANKK